LLSVGIKGCEKLMRRFREGLGRKRERNSILHHDNTRFSNEREEAAKWEFIHSLEIDDFKEKFSSRRHAS